MSWGGYGKNIRRARGSNAKSMAPVVDDTWTKKELKAECRRRVIAGYSRLDKSGLIDSLNKAAVPVGEKVSRTTAGTSTSGSKEATVAELREECRKQGLRNFSKLKKDELVQLLKENKKNGEKSETKEKNRESTLQELHAECRERGMTGFSQLKKEGLVRRMEDYKVENSKVSRLYFRRARQQRSRKSGPLRSRAQERFDSGPSAQDAPGYLYIYFELGGAQNEWKIGKTTLDPPERRMRQSASNNGKVYKLKTSFYVPWCGYTERVLHLDLDDLRVVPGKEKQGGGEKEDGGTEWFRADIGVVEARARLVVRMVASREADEADVGGFAPFCGMFRSCLPTRRRRPRSTPRLAEAGRS